MLFAEFAINYSPYTDQIPRLQEAQLQDWDKRLLDVGSGIGGLSFARRGLTLVDPIYALPDAEIQDLIASDLTKADNDTLADEVTLAGIMGADVEAIEDEMVVDLGIIMDEARGTFDTYSFMRRTFSESFIPVTIEEYLEEPDAQTGFDVIVSRDCLGNGLGRFSPERKHAIEVAKSLLGILNRGVTLGIGPIDGGMVDAKRTRDQILMGSRGVKAYVTQLCGEEDEVKMFIAESMRLATGLNAPRPRRYSLTFQRA